jgi:DNA-binding beta-propeller fold protein YncE
MIVTGSNDKTVRLWNLQGKLISQPLQGHEGAVNSVAFSPDGQMIVTGSDDKTVRLWNLQGNLIGKPFTGSQGGVNSVAFSPSGRIIVSGHGERSQTTVIGAGSCMVCLWDTQGNLIGEPLVWHRDVVSSVAFSPNGQLIASGSDDRTVRLWDVHGNLIGRPFIGHKSEVNSVAFSPDGQTIASSSRDNTVHLWRSSLQAWLSVCCNRLRYHPIFQAPREGSAAAKACETCQKYVWNPKANELNQQGIAKTKNKDFRGAIEVLGQAIEYNVKHIDAYYNRGIAYASLKDYHKAIKDLEYVIKAVSTHAPAHFNRGLCYAKSSNKEAALMDLQKAAKLYRERGQKIQCDNVLKYLEQL